MLDFAAPLGFFAHVVIGIVAGVFLIVGLVGTFDAKKPPAKLGYVAIALIGLVVLIFGSVTS